MAASANALDIFEYDAPIVTIQRGSAWIIDGHFNLVHTINLESFAKILSDLENILEDQVSNKQRKAIIKFHLQQTIERLDELKPTESRSRRSIDWLGAAWKWIAGSPDAADWNQILKSQNEIIVNNNQQYKVNDRLLNISLETNRKLNQLISRFNNIDKETDLSLIEHDILHRTLIVKEEINEIIRACQMAKSGIVNSNLLDKEEINHLLVEVETLPYQNVVEAMEYAKPSIFSNGTMLLYILAMPKIRDEEFRLLLTRATTLHGKRVNIQHQKLLVNEFKTYGLTSNCYSISNSTICEMSSIEKLPEDGCLARLIKGGDARCSYEPHEDEIVELIDDNTIFVTNFAGIIQSGNLARTLNGTYLIQMKNETVYIGNQLFSSRTVKTSQALPSVLSNVTLGGFKPSLEYIQGLNMENISRLSSLGQNFKISTGVEVIILLILTTICYIIWRKITTDIQLPKIPSVRNQKEINGALKNPPVTYIDLRDADI